MEALGQPSDTSAELPPTMRAQLASGPAGVPPDPSLRELLAEAEACAHFYRGLEEAVGDWLPPEARRG